MLQKFKPTHKRLYCIWQKEDPTEIQLPLQVYLMKFYEDLPHMWIHVKKIWIRRFYKKLVPPMEHWYKKYKRREDMKFDLPYVNFIWRGC